MARTTPLSQSTLAAAAAGLVGAAAVGACEPTNEGYAPHQPIAFSHAVHAGANEIPCGYCHYSAERGPWAGIPAASTCLNCHAAVLPADPNIQKVRNAIMARRPIAWTRVNHLPAYVYFNHSAHVRADVACQSCHGAVETMTTISQVAPLTMGFCLDCHRRQTQVAAIGVGGANRLTDCFVCHH